MAVRRPQRQVREYTTGEGHQLGEMPNIGTRFANEFPAECALDLVKSRLDFHGRPAAGPGSDRRLAVFSRALWLGRLATALFGLTLIVTICGMQAMCMFRDYCFRNKPATSPAALAMAFPVAAVVVFVLAPLGLMALKLRIRWLLGSSIVLLIGCCVAMFIGSVWLLATTEPQALTTTVSSAWARLTVLEQRAYRGGQDELRSIVEGDAVVVGVFGLVATVLLGCAALTSLLLWFQWTPGASDTGLCGARYLGPLKRLDFTADKTDTESGNDNDKPSDTASSNKIPAPSSRSHPNAGAGAGEVDESDASEEDDAKPSVPRPTPRVRGGNDNDSGEEDGKVAEEDETTDSADASGQDDGDGAAAGDSAAPGGPAGRPQPRPDAEDESDSGTSMADRAGAAGAAGSSSGRQPRAADGKGRRR